MILANHAGEDVLLAVLAGGGTSAVGGVVLLARTKLDGLLRRLRPRERKQDSR
ncbi:MAG TPA: hypothetical protein VK874_08150 [Gaiellaceae bacterium]|nr:hypothetical protein [Gaiellaceae bacterium]